MTAEPAWENPLMPTATLRQMYAAMLRLHTLLRVEPQFRGLEASLVSPVIDLGPEDFVCDALQTRAPVSLRDHLESSRKRAAESRSLVGAATRLRVPASGSERLWAAIGVAEALTARPEASNKQEGPVIVCYARPGDGTPTVWGRVLAYISANRLPLLIVMLPSLGLRGSSTGRLAKLAIRHRVPGMPVDQHDAVALYRVAHEAIGHARIGGGGALIECVRYILPGRKKTKPDPIADLAQYMLSRRAADRAWLAAQEKMHRKPAPRRTGH